MTREAVAKQAVYLTRRRGDAEKDAESNKENVKNLERGEAERRGLAPCEFPRKLASLSECSWGPDSIGFE